MAQCCVVFVLGFACFPGSLAFPLVRRRFSKWCGKSVFPSVRLAWEDRGRRSSLLWSVSARLPGIEKTANSLLTTLPTCIIHLNKGFKARLTLCLVGAGMAGARLYHPSRDPSLTKLRPSFRNKARIFWLILPFPWLNDSKPVWKDEECFNKLQW